MKNIIKLILFWMIMVSAYPVVLGQFKKPIINFESEIIDFGIIKEEGGIQSRSFTFTNIGYEPLIISNVVASCGCTTPDWTTDPVFPNASGVIKAAYDPNMRPGVFSKNITVYTNADTEPKILTIKGEVVPKSKPLSENYSMQLGNLRFKNTHLYFDKVFNNQLKNDTMYVYNESNDPVTIGFSGLPDHIKITAIPRVLERQGEGKIAINYNAKMKNDFGYVLDRVEMQTDDILQPNKAIVISATIEEYFPPLTEKEKLKAPKISFKTMEFGYGKILEGEVIHHEFEFSNTGKSDLIIRKTSADCGCTASTPDKSTLKPGETSRIKVDFNSRGKSGKDSKRVTVVTNDPANPIIQLVISGEIESSRPDEHHHKDDGHKH